MKINKLLESKKLKEGYSHFEFTSGSNPYIAKTKDEAERIKRSRGDSVKYVGSIDGIDYYKVDDGEEKDLFSVDEAFKPTDSGIQSVKVYNPYNYTIQELRVDNDNKTFERGNFTAGKADKKVKNRQEYEDIVDSLKELGYTEIKSDYRSLRNKTRKGIPTNEATLPRNASKIRATHKYGDKQSMELSKDGTYWREANSNRAYPSDFLRRSFDIEVLETDPNYKPNRTKPEYVVQGNYGYGWEDLTASDSSSEAKADLKAYRENELGVAHRLITRRVPVNESKSIKTFGVKGKKLNEDMNENLYCIVAITKDGKRKFYKDGAFIDDYKEATTWDDLDDARGEWFDIDKSKYKRVFVPNYTPDEFAKFESVKRARNRNLKESKEGRFELNIWVPGSGGDDDRERTLLVSNSMQDILTKAYNTDLDSDECFYLSDWKGIYSPDIDWAYDYDELEDAINNVWNYSNIDDMRKTLGKMLLPQNESLLESNELSNEHAVESVVDIIKRFYEAGGFAKLPTGRKNAFSADISGPDKQRLAGYFDKQEEFNHEINNESGIISHEFISDKYDVEIFDSFVTMYKIPQNESLADINDLTDCPACGDTSFDSRKGKCTKCSYREELTESIDVETIADYITDHYDFDDLDDKYSCINSIKNSFKDEKTISYEELEQFIGSHNGKDKVNESDTHSKQIEKAEKSMFDSLMNGAYNTEWIIQDAKMIYGITYQEATNAFRKAYNRYMIESGELDENLLESNLRNEKGQVMADKWYASKYPDDEIGIEQLKGITLDDALKDRSILGHCDTQVRERVYAQLDKYIPLSKESPMYKEVNEASYGGAFDIADDQYFTREDLDSFAEEVLNHINETFKTQFDIASCYIDNGVLEVGVTNDEYGDYIHSEKIDMRKIKEPWHLKRAYAFEFASQLINDITQSNDGLVESVVSSSYEFDDDTDDLTYYYDDEELKDALTDVWEEISSKQVPDSDGFMTDYTMYRNINTCEYVFVFGDKDIYRPEDGYYDWECETEQEAEEWFDNYHGFEESEFDDFEESYEVDKVFSAACNNRMDYMKKGFEKGKINPNDRFNRFNSDHSYIMGALRNGNKDMVKYLQDQGGTILDDEQDEYNRLMGEEFEKSPIVHKKSDGSYMVANKDGNGYIAYNKDDVCVGNISANNEQEAKNKFNSNTFDE